LWRSLRIKESPAQPFGLPDWPNDCIYPRTTSQGRLSKKVYWQFCTLFAYANTNGEWTCVCANKYDF
jgi:hypothetical protein